MQKLEFTFQYVSIISQSLKRFIRSLNTFTFQYVSIISTGSLFTSLTRIKFTFQYVSIISKIGSFVDGMVKDIYIPICFYYFVIRSNDVRLCNQFTFQYVSIISKNIKSYKI